MPDNELSIVIVNFRSQKYLARCLASIKNKIQSKISTEIIVINNDAAENLENIKSQFSEVIIYNNPKNGGFGQACNLGAGKATGNILFFLNPDTEIISENINEIIREMENTEAGIIGSGLITEKGKNQKWSAGLEISLTDILKNNIGLSKSKKIWKSEKKMPCAWVAGTAMFIRKELFDKISGFDEKFFMYFEDVDLCRRAGMLGHKIVYFPRFQVRHKSGESYMSKKEQKKNYYRSQDYYFKKHRGFLEAALVKLFRFMFS